MVTVESHPLGPGNVSTPVGLISSYVVPLTMTKYPSPVHPVYVSLPAPGAANVRLIVTIESQPLGPVSVSVPVGFVSS